MAAKKKTARKKSAPKKKSSKPRAKAKPEKPEAKGSDKQGDLGPSGPMCRCGDPMSDHQMDAPDPEGRVRFFCRTGELFRPIIDDAPLPSEPPRTESHDEEANKQEERRAREAARMARRRRREQRRAEAPQKGDEGASVTSLEQARQRREQEVSGATQRAAAAADDQGPISIPLEELPRYKLLHLTAQCEMARNAVRKPIKEKYQAALNAQIDKIRQTLQKSCDEEVEKALADDEGYKKAAGEEAAFINDILSDLAPGLPRGYAVTRLEPENGRVIAEYEPDQVGRKLDAPR